MPPKIRITWPRARLHFGAWLTPAILGRHGLAFEWSPLGPADLLGTGGELDLLPETSAAWIVGAGLNFSDVPRSLPHARSLVVRGPLTARQLGLSATTPFGDLGLLADSLLTAPLAARVRLGLVVHRAVAADARLAALAEKHPDEIALIDAGTTDATEVVTRLAGCAAIVSTSVAGLAAAWACGLPAGWITVGAHAPDSDFAFRDFHAAFSRIALPTVFTGEESPDELLARCQPPPAGVDRAKSDLRSALRRVADEFAARSASAPTTPRNALAEGRPETALALARSALSLDPQPGALHRALAAAHELLGDHPNAIASLHRALEIDARDAEALCQLALLHRREERLDLAIDFQAAAARAAPDDPGILHQHATWLIIAGRAAEGLAELRHIIGRWPHFRASHDALVFFLHFQPESDQSSLRAEQTRWARRHAAASALPVPVHRNHPDPHRPLRIGYVAPDFGNHVQAISLLPLLRHHDRSHVHVTVYSLLARQDRQTFQLRAQVQSWREVGSLSDERIAATIRADGIDLLVDLTQHMPGNRLPIFARHPAPVQLAWLAYPGGTGLTTMDYRLTDARLDPPGTEADSGGERPIRLPDTFWLYDPLAPPTPIPPLPALRHGFVTFGCFCAFHKISDPAFALWARVLTAIPDSRLLVRVPGEAWENPVRARFAGAGIAPERVSFTRPLPRPAYLAAHDAIDIALDPIPYGGHITLCDALWRSVPTIALPGKTIASRAGVSLLTAMSMTDWVAASEDDYVRIASDKARDLPALAALRSELRSRFTASPIMDAPRFARNLEATYRSLWQAWCADKSAPSPPPTG